MNISRGDYVCTRAWVVYPGTQYIFSSFSWDGSAFRSGCSNTGSGVGSEPVTRQSSTLEHYCAQVVLQFVTVGCCMITAGCNKDILFLLSAFAPAASQLKLMARLLQGYKRGTVEWWGLAASLALVVTPLLLGTPHLLRRALKAVEVPKKKI